MAARKSRARRREARWAREDAVEVGICCCCGCMMTVGFTWRGWVEEGIYKTGFFITCLRGV